MVHRGMVRCWRSGLLPLGLAVATAAASAQEIGEPAADELRLQEIRRGFWALTDTMSSPEGAEPGAAADARIRIVPPLCREFLLDFPDSSQGVRVRWLLGRAWALARGDAARATDALEGAVIAYLNGHGPGQIGTSLAPQLGKLGVITPRGEGEWWAATEDIEGDGAAEIVLSYRFAGPRAQLGGFCSLLGREDEHWRAQRILGPPPALASAMADVPMGPGGYRLEDLNRDGRHEILLLCRAAGEQQGLLLVFGLRQGQMRRLLWANCPDGEYQLGSHVDGWPQIIIRRRFDIPETPGEGSRRRERDYFAFDGRRYAFARTHRDAATYLYEQFWDGRDAYDAGNFERSARLLDRAAIDDALKARPREAGPGQQSRPAQYPSEADERRSYRATARYLAGLAYAHVGEMEKARRAMTDVVSRYTYVQGVSAYDADFLPGLWAKRFNSRYERPTDLYAALAQIAPAYALYLYLTDHPPEEPSAAILNSGVRTEQALVTDVTGDYRGDIIVALPAATGSGRAIVVFVRTGEGWRGYAVAGEPEVRAEQERGMPRRAITLCGLSAAADSAAHDAAQEWVVSQVADFDADGVKDIEVEASRTMRLRWDGRGFALAESEAPPDKSAATPSGDDTHQRDLASLDQIADAIYDRRKFEPALTWLDTLEGRLGDWEDSARARALLAEVAYHRALCHAHLGQWEQAARSYTAVAEHYRDLAWAAPAKARAKALPSHSQQMR